MGGALIKSRLDDLMGPFRVSFRYHLYRSDAPELLRLSPERQ